MKLFFVYKLGLINIDKTVYIAYANDQMILRSQITTIN